MGYTSGSSQESKTWQNEGENRMTHFIAAESALDTAGLPPADFFIGLGSEASTVTGFGLGGCAG